MVRRLGGVRRIVCLGRGVRERFVVIVVVCRHGRSELASVGKGKEMMIKESGVGRSLGEVTFQDFPTEFENGRDENRDGSKSTTLEMGGEGFELICKSNNTKDQIR